MEIDRSPEWLYNGLYTWSVVEPDFKFASGQGLSNSK